MARNIIKSNNTVVAVQNATTAFSTSNEGLKLHKIAQTFEYSIDYSRQQSKQIGSQDLAANEIYNQPDVSLNISYIPEPNFSNEVQGRFLGGTPKDNYINMFSSSDSEDSTNFYVLVGENQEDSFIDSITFGSPGNLNGDDPRILQFELRCRRSP